MNQREQLIEKMRSEWARIQNWDRDDGRSLWDVAADVALTVFEEAHTPTDHHVDHHDDEREAEARRIWPLDREYTAAQMRAVFSVKELDAYCASAFMRGAKWAAGFHRTVQGEPSNVSEPGVSDISPAQMSVQGDLSLRDHVRNLTDASDAELDALGGFTGEPSAITLSARGVGKTQALIEAILAQANKRGIRLEVVYPQGEPTVAQVIAAMNAYDPRFPGEDLDDFQENEIADMRAALRAAAAVQGGERHGD